MCAIPGEVTFLFSCPLQGVLMGYDEQAMTSWMVGCMRLHSWRLHEERITKSAGLRFEWHM